MFKRLIPSLLLILFTGHYSAAHDKNGPAKKPSAQFSANQLTFISPFVVKFDGSASQGGPGQPLVDYIWDFDDDKKGHHDECSNHGRDHK